MTCENNCAYVVGEQKQIKAAQSLMREIRSGVTAVMQLDSHDEPLEWVVDEAEEVLGSFEAVSDYYAKPDTSDNDITEWLGQSGNQEFKETYEDAQQRTTHIVEEHQANICAAQRSCEQPRLIGDEASGIGGFYTKCTSRAMAAAGAMMPITVGVDHPSHR